MALNAGEGSVASPYRLTPREKSLWYSGNGLVGPNNASGCPDWESHHSSTFIQPIDWSLYRPLSPAFQLLGEQ
jgi:hypothetical protein